MASKPKVMAPANDVRDHAPQAEDTVGKDRAQERENTGTALDRTQGTVNMSATAVRGRGSNRVCGNRRWGWKRRKKEKKI